MLAPIGRKRLEIELQLALAAAGSGCKPLKPQSGFEMSPHLGTAQIHNSCTWYRIKELYQVQTHSCKRYSCSKCLHTSLTAARVIRSPALLILLNSVFFFRLRPHFYFILPSFAFFLHFSAVTIFCCCFKCFPVVSPLPRTFFGG